MLYQPIAVTFRVLPRQLIPRIHTVEMLYSYVYKKQILNVLLLFSSDILRLDGRNADAVYVRGLSLYYQDNVEKAFQHFKQCLQLAPDHTKARDIYRVRALSLPSSFPLSPYRPLSPFQHFKQCLQLAPDHTKARDIYREGLLSPSLPPSPSLPTSLSLPFQAFQHFKQCLQLAPDHTKARDIYRVGLLSPSLSLSPPLSPPYLPSLPLSPSSILNNVYS